MSELQQIIPRPGEVRPYRTPEQHWREVVEKIYGSSALPENIPFVHNPNWRHEGISIQWTHDKVEQFMRGPIGPYIIIIEFAVRWAIR